jgi:ankyrin repeat protein
LKYFKEKQANINAQDKFRLSPLHYAAIKDDEEAMKFLLECKNIEIQASSSKFKFKVLN